MRFLIHFLIFSILSPIFSNQTVFSNHFIPAAAKCLLKIMTFLYVNFFDCFFDLIIWYWYMYSITMYNCTLIMLCVVSTFNVLRSGKSSGIFIAIFYILVGSFSAFTNMYFPLMCICKVFIMCDYWYPTCNMYSLMVLCVCSYNTEVLIKLF